MHIRICCRSLCSLLVLVGSATLFSQNPPVSDPQALSLVSQSMTALTGGTSMSDVTLRGAAKWIVASSSETANATLRAKGTKESRFDMTLGVGPRSEIRNDNSSTSLGEVLASDGTVHPWSIGNCLTNASWFFPQLSVLGATGDPTLIFVYVGLESRNGVSVQHIQSYRYTSMSAATTRLLSTMDIYLDATSFLPTAFAFNTTPIRGAAQNIGVEADFSNYKSVNGIQVPFRIQRYVAGNLGFDLSVMSVQFNSGLSDSLFAIQ
ncbi:MAG: hypothetical protein ABSD76_19965 [Terriglobales bacterium]|jgi:hypothetical protein